MTNSDDIYTKYRVYRYEDEEWCVARVINAVEEKRVFYGSVADCEAWIRLRKEGVIDEY